MFAQIPDFPQAAQDNYPLLITFILYTLVLLGGASALVRYSFLTIKGIANEFVKSLEKLLVSQEEQTSLLLDIHDAVTDEHNGQKQRRKKRGV